MGSILGSPFSGNYQVEFWDHLLQFDNIFVAQFKLDDGTALVRSSHIRRVWNQGRVPPWFLQVLILGLHSAWRSPGGLVVVSYLWGSIFGYLNPKP